MFRWGATVIACLGLATMTGCGLGIEGESPEVSFKSKAEERGAEGETHSGKPGGPSGSGDHETGAQLSGDTLKSSDEGTGGGGSSSGEQATTAREGNTETTGVLPKPGPFDPTAPGFELFDPCSEQVANKLSVLGFNRARASPLIESGFRMCTFVDHRDGELGISSDAENLGKPEEDGERFLYTRSVNGASLHYYRGTLFVDEVCEVQWDSENGMLSVSLLVDNKGVSHSDICDDVGRIFRQLLDL